MAPETTAPTDIFVRDRTTETTERVSVDSAGNQGKGQSSDLAISANGRFVAFTSSASNLVPDDTFDVFVRDRVMETTERVSVGNNDDQANSPSVASVISADGRFVTFWSGASSLVSEDTNGALDVFVRDRLTGTTERTSVDNAGSQGNSTSQLGVVSGDGGVVAFVSLASNLVPGDTNDASDVFVHNRDNDSVTAATSLDWLV